MLICRNSRFVATEYLRSPYVERIRTAAQRPLARSCRWAKEARRRRVHAQPMFCANGLTAFPDHAHARRVALTATRMVIRTHMNKHARARAHARRPVRSSVRERIRTLVHPE
eukprot:5908795-Pleurochrysis_carterae.AAC.2